MTPLFWFAMSLLSAAIAGLSWGCRTGRVVGVTQYLAVVLGIISCTSLLIAGCLAMPPGTLARVPTRPRVLYASAENPQLPAATRETRYPVQLPAATLEPDPLAGEYPRRFENLAIGLELGGPVNGGGGDMLALQDWEAASDAERRQYVARRVAEEIAARDRPAVVSMQALATAGIDPGELEDCMNDFLLTEPWLSREQAKAKAIMRIRGSDAFADSLRSITE